VGISSYKDDFDDFGPPLKALDMSAIMQAIESSRSIVDLKDNWDDEGAVGYSQDTWDRATRFLQKLAALAFRSLGVTVDPPRILPGPEGGIDILRKTDRYELLINIPANPAEPASYYGDNKLGNMPIKNTFHPSKPDRKLVAWLCLFE
jgi:hypothetical protein